jgi:hypothetical protein
MSDSKTIPLPNCPTVKVTRPHAEALLRVLTREGNTHAARILSNSIKEAHPA